MELTVLGSGGCMVIPKPLCRCRVCKEARAKGVPYERTGPSVFIHDENLLVDTPAETALQLNRCRIQRVDHLLFTHLDPDHTEGFRVVEQQSLDFRTWRAYPEKQVRLILPETLETDLRRLRSVYGPFIDFYRDRGFVSLRTFRDHIRIGALHITALPVDRGEILSFVYVFEKEGRKVIYAPCDLRPFPEGQAVTHGSDLLIIQPGIFESGLKHGFVYPEDHISRSTLYTFDETLALADRISAKQVLFVHLEEYWNRTHDDYLALESEYENIRFAFDGMRISI